MRLTRFGIEGLVFYFALLGTFFAAPYSNLFFLLLAFLSLQWVLGAYWTQRNLRGVRGEFAEIAPMPSNCGGEARVHVATGGRRSFGVAVEVELDCGTKLVSESASVRGEQLVSAKVPPLPRGVHSLRAASIRSEYPFGILAARRSLEAPPELIVYPAPTELAETRSGSHSIAELLGGVACEAGSLQPAGLRDHREGDEPRSVHWRATARRGSLVVREWEGGGGDGLEVVVDRRCDAEELERALSVVSAIVSHARESKEALAIHSQGLSETYGEGHRPWADALRFLASADVVAPGGPPPPPVSPSITRLPQELTGGR